ncbi:hypothetical protein RJ639_019288 [Escallonia herrerae]|uniref:Protein kinase domain-containing protein n=1 Tax=Escallonia herrerae TaxID=1293975 RepID=A0AA88V6F8_9ASTE|nr:hypothetical protein RJ639_019288 [Escallonia herrerae]
MGIQWVVGITFLLWVTGAAVEGAAPLAKPGCSETCGNVTIPFPFGMESADCYGDPSLEITCNDSSNPPAPFIKSTNFQVLKISLPTRSMLVKTELDQMSVSSISFSSVELSWNYSGRCYYHYNGGYYNYNGVYHQSCRCLPGYEGNPYLEGGCQDVDECNMPISGNSTSCSGGRCVNASGDSNTTLCSVGRCINTVGDYYCSCPSGYGGRYGCYKVNDNKARMAIIGTSSGLGAVILIGGAWCLYKLILKRKKKQQRQKYFKRNGGLLLEQQLSSGEEGNVEKTKLFTSKELEKATDNYNKNRILGQGGQGTVYKGMLADGRIVAIKKSKIEDDEGKVEHFINEVAILSQIRHRNVVKLHGCCLETEVPLLVYEFIPNGTLFDFIQDQNEELPLPCWDMRLQIGREVAGALSYLHSAASMPIYHRDIKSTNILLDDKYRAKVADFGTSRSIAIEQTHLTTRVMGTIGYLDPEYFQTNQFTDKSDVYSFGVVLIELLTGQKAISSTKSEEGRSLATNFLLAMEENCLHDILDKRVAKEGTKEQITKVANLAKGCLNLNGRKRPTMKEVAMELEGLPKSQAAPSGQLHYQEEDECTIDMEETWPNMPLANSSSTSSLDITGFKY